jgi:hypothetical protein
MHSPSDLVMDSDALCGAAESERRMAPFTFAVALLALNIFCTGVV